ncbi:MAG: PTS sugar transporter subunit IIA [Spirochaetaceae bacterium]|nr:PTS sugar transporter subunit IIA [Spirochaetaceae bacterium]
MILGEVFSPKTMCVELESEEKEEVLAELVEIFVRANPGIDRSQVLTTVVERENKMSTGFLKNVAVPHGRSACVEGIHGVIGIARNGIDFDSLDGEPTYLFFLLVSSLDESELHLRVLKRLTELLEKGTFYADLLQQSSADGMYKVLCRYEDELVSF